MLRSWLAILFAAAAFSSIRAFSIDRRQVLSTFSSTTAAATCLVAASPIAAYAEEETNEFVEGPRGLKYQVMHIPRCLDCAVPERAQKVKTLYTLWLGGFPEDGGKQIDSSKGFLGEKPFEFYAGVSQVIKGWDLAILDMREGEKRRLIVPASLGYGDKGAGGRIPGGSTLYFEVELVEVGDKLKLKPEQVKWLEDNPV